MPHCPVIFLVLWKPTSSDKIWCFWCFRGLLIFDHESPIHHLETTFKKSLFRLWGRVDCILGVCWKWSVTYSHYIPLPTISAVMRLERNALSLILVMTFLSLSLSETSLAKPICYYPDGSIAQSDLPCGNSTDVACCGGSAICLTNGLCLDVSQPNTLARSSCTDKTWTSGNCPNYCLQSEWWKRTEWAIRGSDTISSSSLY